MDYYSRKAQPIAKDSTHWRRITNAVQEYIAEAMVSLQTVENPSFTRMLTALCARNKGSQECLRLRSATVQ